MLEERNMSLQVNKKGISEVIGYLLLVAVSITISILVYQWLKTYVPSEALNCPDGTSVYINDYNYKCSLNHDILNVTIQNNGRFSIYGFFVHISNSTKSGGLDTIDISQNILNDSGQVDTNRIYGSAVAYLSLATDNEFNPASSVLLSFNVTKYENSIGTAVNNLEIIPMRLQEDSNNKKRTVSCTNAKVDSVITCSQ
jgi:hypothetical protein